MKIRTEKLLDGNVFRVTISTEDFSELDLELMAKYDEPEIDTGGAFTGPPAFTIDTNLSGIKSGSPFKYGFDSADYVDAEARANVWAAEVIQRIKDELTTLRANSDGFTGETCETF